MHCLLEAEKGDAEYAWIGWFLCLLPMMIADLQLGFQMTILLPLPPYCRLSAGVDVIA